MHLPFPDDTRRKTEKRIRTFLQSAGYKYWTASLLPAIVGTTLPFWLKPPGFSFRTFEAIEFLLATFICIIGFSLLLTYFKNRNSTIEKTSNSKYRWAMISGLICISITIISGIHLNSQIVFQSSVYPYIFLFYGIGVLFTGLLYVFPPFSFFKRLGGEVILYFGLGMLPILGSYLVQVGDLTRTVYIASVPVVIATALWIWVEEMIQRLQNEKAGYQNAVMLISSRFAGRILTPILILLIYGTLFVAVFGRPALHPFSLFALISFGLGYRIFKVCWNFFDQPPELDKVRNYPIFIHLILCAAIIFSSLLT